jgi:hypothetical protein
MSEFGASRRERHSWHAKRGIARYAAATAEGGLRVWFRCNGLHISRPTAGNLASPERTVARSYLALFYRNNRLYQVEGTAFVLGTNRALNVRQCSVTGRLVTHTVRGARSIHGSLEDLRVL